MYGREVNMFDDEIIIGSIRAQSDRLESILDQMERDELWKRNSSFYAIQIQEIERRLRRIRRNDIEPLN